MNEKIIALGKEIAGILKEKNPYVRIEITVNEIKIISTEASVPVEIHKD